MEIIGQGRPETVGDPDRAGVEYRREAQSASELRADSDPLRVEARCSTAVPFESSPCKIRDFRGLLWWWARNNAQNGHDVPPKTPFWKDRTDLAR